MYMNKILSKLKNYIALTLYGISTFNIYPNIDYNQYISTSEDMMRQSWERTGKALQHSIDTLGAIYEKKQSTRTQ